MYQARNRLALIKTGVLRLFKQIRESSRSVPSHDSRPRVCLRPFRTLNSATEVRTTRYYESRHGSSRRSRFPKPIHESTRWMIDPNFGLDSRNELKSAETKREGARSRA